MTTPSVEYRGSIAVLHLGDNENRFTPDWLAAVDKALDDVASGQPAALLTVGGGKFYSNGLDLEWLSANSDQFGAYVDAVHWLFSKVLTLGVPTVAAINGHAFGAGAMLAMAHDFRVMRADRGFFCFPEADIRIPFTPGMSALIQAKLTPQAAVASMTTARRFGGADAAELGIVDRAVSEDALIGSASSMVEGLVGKDYGTLETIKTRMYPEVLAALKEGIGG